ncbi:EamA family transporter [Mucilaginibacter sp. BT774]|uniref:EamA family transporter n=1 Tax=Mucilaginibacter sp. BT774 TaxID=3062276 RepID=UPI00267545A7|nr:EamA family transporter [Mucilaginibacter sp. BT774]MDO3625475.1 EamA family transporter [Mucilaginibacter sp. BT774]
MFYIFLSICCSVTVSVLLKLAKRYQIDVYQAITWNYSAAIFLTWLFFRPQLISLQGTPVLVYLSLGILFPSLFIIIATSIKLTGIVRTDVAQRLSLFIPVLASFLIFGEKPNTIKIIGIAIGFVAIVCLIPWRQRSAVRRRSTNAWFYLVVILIGMGVIDVLLKSISKSNISFGTSLFIIFTVAFSVAFIGLIYMVFTKMMRFSWPHILIGWVLGAANFGNILFYIKGLNALADHPSTVFSTMDIGVIVAGSLVGLFIFREKLSRLNVGGIILAIIAVVIIYFPEIFNF